MAINPNDISNDYIIEVFKNSIQNGDNKLIKTVTVPPDGSKTITFSNHFGLGNISTGDELRISDGSTTITYTITHPGGGNAPGATDIGGGSDRAAEFVVDEFVSKITSSALDITATDLGTVGSGAAFKLTPGSGKTITITEDPSADGNFGSSAGFTTISDSGGGSSTTTEFKASPFRNSRPGTFNLKSQTSTNSYRSFIGDQSL